MKNCSNCGHQYNEASAYCPNCGSASSIPVGMQQPTYGAVVQEQKTNGMCIAGFICSLLCISPIGLILSIIGLIQAKKKNQKGKGLGIAGLILSILSLIVTVLMVFLFVGVIGLANGTAETYKSIQEGCKNLDANGSYVSIDGYTKCENHTCEYNKDGFRLSLSCNVVDLDDLDDIIDNAIIGDEEDITNDNNNSDENYNSPIETPAVSTSIPSNDFMNTSWVASDNSEIKFSSNEFYWYAQKNVYTDNFYKGVYKLYKGDEAVKFITNDLASYEVKKEEIDRLLNDGLYLKDNFIVVHLVYTSTTLDGVVTQKDNEVIPWFGFIIEDGKTLDVANMNTGTYYRFSKLG